MLPAVVCIPSSRGSPAKIAERKGTRQYLPAEEAGRPRIGDVVSRGVWFADQSSDSVRRVNYWR